MDKPSTSPTSLGQCFRTACLSPLQLMTSQERALAFLRGHIGRSCPSTPVATREGFRNSSSASPAGTTASYANSTTDWAVDHRCLEPNEPLAARLPRSACSEVFRGKVPTSRDDKSGQFAGGELHVRYETYRGRDRRLLGLGLHCLACGSALALDAIPPQGAERRS